MDQAESLQKFLSETVPELSRRLTEFNEALEYVQSDQLDNVKKMLESAFKCWENITTSMEGFKTVISKRHLMKDSLNVPHVSFLSEDRNSKRDSGIASSISSNSPYVSSNRLSTSDDDVEPGGKVSFNLQSTHVSLSDFSESTVEEVPEPNYKEISTVYIHMLPSDPTTDLSALREKIHNLSRSTLKTDNVQLHLVPSDSFIGIPSRQQSVSTEGSSSARPSRQLSTSSEGINYVRYRLPSSNDSLVSAVMSMSSKVPEEHTDSSDDQSSRLVSSSDSEVSVVRYRLQHNSIETQTDSENNMAGSRLLDQNSVETQTD